MNYLVVELACQSCSFRIPEFQNFHKSYELPPPTTIIGIAGAALGLSPKAAQDFFDESCVFGVYGYHLGKTNDLWKYQKLRGKEFISDILTREVLFESLFCIVYGINDDEKVQRLQEAFKSPVYALTMGNSDGLAKVVEVTVLSETIECNEIENCIVEGNLLQEVLVQPKGLEFSLQDGTSPLNYEVPVSFHYDSEYGVRRVSKRKELSFLGSETKVKGLNKEGVLYKNYQIPVFNLHA